MPLKTCRKGLHQYDPDTAPRRGVMAWLEGREPDIDDPHVGAFWRRCACQPCERTRSLYYGKEGSGRLDG